MMSLEYDTLIEAMKELRSVSARKGQNLLISLARQFVRNAMRFTPPFPGKTRDGKSMSEPMRTHYNVGARNVGRDIMRVFKPLSTFNWYSNYSQDSVGSRVRELVTGRTTSGKRKAPTMVGMLRQIKSGGTGSVRSFGKVVSRSKAIGDRLTAIRAIFQNMGLPDPIMVVSPTVHQAARTTKRRTVPKKLLVTARRVLIDERTLQPYIDKIKGHVGKSKGGWGLAASSLKVNTGREYQHWISRHDKMPGIYIPELSDTKKGPQYITVGNQVAWRHSFDVDRIMSDAMQVLSKQVRKEVAIIKTALEEKWAKRKMARTNTGWSMRVSRFGGPVISAGPVLRYTGGLTGRQTFSR